MTTDLNFIITTIENSKLTDMEKLKMTEVLEQGEAADFEAIAKVLRENPEWIERLQKNIRAKTAAFMAGDRQTWEKILQDEESVLETLK